MKYKYLYIAIGVLAVSLLIWWIASKNKPTTNAQVFGAGVVPNLSGRYSPGHGEEVVSIQNKVGINFLIGIRSQAAYGCANGIQYRTNVSNVNGVLQPNWMPTGNPCDSKDPIIVL